MNKPQVQTMANAALTGWTVVFDTETTGLESGDQIVEIAAVSNEGQVLLNTLVRPTVSIPWGATRIHGLTDADVQNAPTFKEVMYDLDAIVLFEQGYLTSYNLAFDIRMLRQSASLNGVDKPFDEAIRDYQRRSTCIMELYSLYRGAQIAGLVRWQSLARALEQQGLDEPRPAHRALGDAKAAHALLSHMAGNLVSRNPRHR